MAKVAKVQSRKAKRKGRGFSVEELNKAGISLPIARKLKVPVDTRRKSAYDFNVDELKKLELPEKKPKAKKAVKAAPKKKAPPKPKKEAKKDKAKASSSAAKIKAIEEEKEKKIQEAMARAKAEKK